MTTNISVLGVTWRTALKAVLSRWGHLSMALVAALAVGVLGATAALLTSRLFNGLDQAIPRNGQAGGEALETSIAKALDGRSFENLGQLKDLNPVLKVVLGDLPSTNLNFLILASVALSLVLVVNFLATRARTAIDAALFVRLRSEAFERSFRQDRSAVVREDAVRSVYGGDTSTRLSMAINRGANAVAGLYSLSLNLVQQLLTFVITAVTAGSKYLPITLACGAVILVQVLISLWQARRLRGLRTEADAEINRLQGRTANWLDNRELILVFDKGEKYEARLGDLTDKLANKTRGIRTVEAFAEQLYQFIRELGQIGVVLMAAGIVLTLGVTGPDSQGQSLIFYAITLYATLLNSARSLISGFDSLKSMTATSQSYAKLLVDTEAAANPTPGGAWTPSADIRLEKVGYRYPGAEKPTITDLDLVLPGGKVTVILGPSGCGKTTIGKLVLGLVGPPEGSIDVGGRPLGAWSIKDLHGQSSYMPQLGHVLDSTVADNLRLAETDRAFTNAEMLAALEEVGLRPAVGDPTGEALLSREALELSGGEMQRVAAARVLLDTSDILVLDEPLAGVDVDTMAAIVPVLERRWRDRARTVVIISHKLVFASIAHEIILLDARGKVVANGPPQGLQSNSPRYQQLLAVARSQTGT